MQPVGPPHTITCPGCGAMLPARGLPPCDQYHASGECYELCMELSYYSLGKGDPDFIHQLVVDAYMAQHAGSVAKNIGPVFALIGLCLVIEHGYTGRQVQLVHMKIPKQNWPALEPPRIPAAMTVQDVLKAASDAEKDELIHAWVKYVWESWAHAHDWIRELASRYQ